MPTSSTASPSVPRSAFSAFNRGYVMVLLSRVIDSAQPGAAPEDVAAAASELVRAVYERRERGTMAAIELGVRLALEDRALLDDPLRARARCERLEAELAEVRKTLSAALHLDPDADPASALELAERCALPTSQASLVRDLIAEIKAKTAGGTWLPSQEELQAARGAAANYRACQLDLVADVQDLIVGLMSTAREWHQEHQLREEGERRWLETAEMHQRSAHDFAGRLNAAHKQLDALGVPASKTGDVAERIKLLCEMRQRVAQPQVVRVQVVVDTSEAEARIQALADRLERLAILQRIEARLDAMQGPRE